MELPVIDTVLDEFYPQREHIQLDHQLTPSVVCNILPADLPFQKSPGDEVFAVCCGVGVDSIAGIVEMANRGIRPDLITFADTGGERPETYEYIPVLQQFLDDKGFPPLVIVRVTPPKASYTNLYENMIANATLPSIAYGMKSCSLRWKKAPQDEW